MPDYAIRVKVTVKFVTLAIAAPVKEKDDDDGGKGRHASSNSARDRTSIAAAFTSRTGWHNDNRRANGGGNNLAIGFRLSGSMSNEKELRNMCAYTSSDEKIEVNVDVIGGAPELRVTGLAVMVMIPGVVGVVSCVFAGVGVVFCCGVGDCCSLCEVGGLLELELELDVVGGGTDDVVGGGADTVVTGFEVGGGDETKKRKYS
jgi:hypothetical protein